MSILVVGSVAFDNIETPFGKAERCLGGSATYFSVAASFFTDVELVAVVGDDFSEKDLEIFRGRRVNLDGEVWVTVAHDRGRGLDAYLQPRLFGDLPERALRETLSVPAASARQLPESGKGAARAAPRDQDLSLSLDDRDGDTTRSGHGSNGYSSSAWPAPLWPAGNRAGS